MIHLEIEEEPWTHRDPALISLFTLGRWSTLTSVLVQLGDATTHLATGFWEEVEAAVSCQPTNWTVMFQSSMVTVSSQKMT